MISKFKMVSDVLHMRTSALNVQGLPKARIYFEHALQSREFEHRFKALG